MLFTSCKDFYYIWSLGTPDTRCIRLTFTKYLTFKRIGDLHHNITYYNNCLIINEYYTKSCNFVFPNIGSILLFLNNVVNSIYISL